MGKKRGVNWNGVNVGYRRKVPPARGGDGMFKTGSSSSLTSLDEDMSDIEEVSHSFGLLVVTEVSLMKGRFAEMFVTN